MTVDPSEFMVETRDCPLCGETIKAAAVKCRFCRADLKALGSRAKAEPGGEKVFFEGRPAYLLSLGEWSVAVLTLGLAMAWFWWRRQGVRYRITDRRLQIETGVLSKSLTNLELFRIDDYDLRQPLGMRLVGHARLVLRTSDRDQADVVLAGLPYLGYLAELIRDCGLRERERLGIKVWADS